MNHMSEPLGTVVLDFSGVYADEGFRPDGARFLDLKTVEGTDCYCDPSAADRIRAAIAPYPYSGVHWIDGGDYHYASLFWLEKIDRPFCLMLFDNHSDDQSCAFGGDILSCGSWVAEAKKSNGFLREVIWVHHAADFRMPADPDIPVYLSIDKDVLREEDARTNWDQGDLTLEELSAFIRRTDESRRILGIDVCGEIPASKGGVENEFILNCRTNVKLQELFISLQNR